MWSHDMSHDIRSQAQTLGEEIRRIMLEYIYIAQYSYEKHEVDTQTTHGHQDRVIYYQHRP